MEWVFDPVPASGARSGGDPSAFVFEARLDAFVREVIQNAVDAGLPDRQVRFRLSVEVREGAALDALRDVVAWDQLREHLEAAATDRATEQQRFARALEGADGPEVVLWVEDRGTIGLGGPESGDGRFAALCRDRLFSDKQSETAGGSFGLGKAVLWRFSRWSTVLFYSRPADEDHRLIAKAVLPWHDIDGRGYAGDGWLGRREGLRAVSIRGDGAKQAIERLGRDALEESGTTIGILGFEDPAETPAGPPETARALLDAAERHFWPALARGALQVEVFPEVAQPRTGPWREMLRRYDDRAEQDQLRDIGDVVTVAIPWVLPKRRGGGSVTEGAVDLVVRRSHAADPEVYDRVSFRRPGMVVERVSEQRLGRVEPFHALVIAGLARRDRGPTDEAIDAFLRDAEPPSHDRWVKTPRLRQSWALGYGKALDQLHADIRERLRSLVARAAESADGGPAGLRALFPVPGVGGGRESSAFRFEDLRAALTDGRWVFSGAVAPTVPLEGPWTVRIDARFPEDHGPGVGGLVEALRTSTGAVSVVDGTAVVEAPAGTREVRFDGVTDPARYPVDPRHGALELVVRGVEAR